MKRFNYTAVDRAGQQVEGSVDAADWSAAVELLTARGLVDCRQVGAEGTPELTSADAVELAGYLSELAKSGLPLSGALRALARDASSPSLRRAIDDLSAKLESGDSLDMALDALGAQLPEHVRRLLVAAARSGRLSQTLERLLEGQRRTDDMARRFRQAVAYPVVLLALLVAWLLFITWDVVPSLGTILKDDFGAHAESWSLTATKFLPAILIGSLAAVMLVLVVVRALGGAGALSRLLAVLPLVGPCRANRGLADFAGLLSEFLDERMPLDESLLLTAAGARDPAVRAECRKAASAVAQGGRLSQSLDRSSLFPKTLVRWVEWGENNAALPDALRAAATMFAERFELRLQVVRVIVPAIVFGLIAASAVFVAVSVLQNLLTMVRELSTFTPTARESESLQLVGVAGAAGVLVLGTALLVAARSLGASRSSADVTGILLRSVGWTFVVAAPLIACLLLAGGWGLIGWIVLVLGWLRGAWRYRQAQKQSLWAALSLAADKQVPLGPMARAFADEQRGGFATAARNLALQLERGVDLAEAIARSAGALPREAALAARIGTDAGDLSGAVRATTRRRGGQLLLPQPVLWLMLFIPVVIVTVVFVQLRIAPSWVKINDDFETPLPAVTIVVLQFLNSPLAVWLGLAFLALLIIVWFQWRGTLQPRLPGLKRIVRWIELAPVLRTLALVTRRERPLPQALETIAMWHPNRWIRRRMRAAVRDLARGITWQESFRRRRLLAVADQAVLSAAERNGNLPWALEEMGNSYARRAEFRLKAWGEFALPLLLAAVGLAVAVFVIAYFVPLVYLINNLG
jgi:type II secretory pathway component PulF